MPIKISKVIKDLNVGALTIREFLEKKNIEVDSSVNARIDDSVYAMLIKEFRPDMEQRLKADDASKERQKGKEKEKNKVEDIKTEIPTTQKPKILGKIDLNSGKAVKTEAPKTEEKPKVEEPKAEPVKAVEKPKAEPKPEKKEEPKAEPKPEKKEEPKPAAPKVEEKPKAQPKAEPAKVEEKPEPKPEKKEESKPAETKAEPEKKEEEIISLKPTAPAAKLTIVGKIDLDAINSSTRPKPKTKEEKRKERIAKEKAEGAARKKRKRIGKEKVDIERSGAMIQNQPNQGGKKNGGNNQNDQGGKRKDKKAKRPFKPEVSEEDVQRQIKETLAQLAAKKNSNKKGAKWRKEKREAVREEEREVAMQAAAERKILKLTEFVTANDLAAMMDIPVIKVIGTCMSLGIMVSINQRLDAETINIVAEEFGFKTEYASAEVVEAIQEEEDRPEDLEERAPVVTVMGHVDHGKTSLLDHIRNTNVIAGEAGGITQHIGAYIVKLKNGRRITFLDTPGHAAFTAMRARGAKVTDIAIIIVAADDDVMPQTDEALSHASAAGVPIIFAINKIDKPGADPEKIKEQLAQRNYLVEEWGGKYQSQDISAKKGTGVFELLEKVLLEADMLELKANPNRKATGSVIESSLDKGRGYVATVLVDNGTLRVGDTVLAGTHYGKVKAMFNERNQRITEAGPACPALILGLNGAPTAGDKFNVMDTDQEARQIANKREQLQREQDTRTMKRMGLDEIGRRMALGEFHELNIIVKGDVDGSIEALSDSLIKLSTEEVKVNVVHKAVGAISESDVTLAAASDAYIVGFQVRPSADAKRLAAKEGVDIRIYSIIYDAIEEIKAAMQGMLSAEVKEEVCGTAEVLQTYHISKVGTIAGAIVREGKIKRSCKVRVIRDGIVRYTGTLASLKRFKDDAKEVATGFDCGLSLQSYNDIVVGDMIEAFEEVEVQRTL
ncbi:MAG: translation initiation factor IF-2 [Muribaculaceae bacterium]|nr:translation initiation factor IF-2 [Muribaculaceae bacterium]